jgi:hypothetical protein
MMVPALSFEPHWRLGGLRPRMRVSIAAVEDAVQEAYLRWEVCGSTRTTASSASSS